MLDSILIYTVDDDLHAAGIFIPHCFRIRQGGWGGRIEMIAEQSLKDPIRVVPFTARRAISPIVQAAAQRIVDISA